MLYRILNNSRNKSNISFMFKRVVRVSNSIIIWKCTNNELNIELQPQIL